MSKRKDAPRQSALNFESVSKPAQDDPAPAAPAAPAQEIDPFELEQQQRKALDLTKNRVISASAGTGKTHTLTALYAGLLAGRVTPGGQWLQDESEWFASLGANNLPPAPHEIVAVTFTKKAAAELLQRTRQALEQTLRRQGLPEKLKDHLEKCRQELASAPVCTIDAFCARLLREAGARSEAPIQFAMLEPPDAAEMLEQVLCDVAAEQIEKDPALKRLASEWGVSQGLAETGGKLLAGLRTRGLSPKDLIRQPPALSCAEMRQRLEQTLADARNPPGKPGKAKCPERLTAWAAEPPAMADQAQLHRVALELSALLDCAWARNAGVADPTAEILSVIHAPLAQALAAYLEAAQQRYAEQKRQRGCVDFSDVLIFARKLLDRAPNAASSYRFVLIDEYQDTNPLQCDILKRVAFGAAGAGAGVKLAVVGDRKQSIYRFRGADVTQMKSAEEDARFGAAPLRRNFRSRKHLIEFFNGFFTVVSSHETGFVYDQEHVLEPDLKDPERHGWTGPAAEVLDFADRLPAEAHRWQQARTIARRIRTLVAPQDLQPERGAKPLERPRVWDKKARCLRPPGYSDIAILARSVKNVRVPLQLALSQMGIPFRMLGGLTFYTRQEVLDVTNLLACVADPYDNLALSAWLRSPLAGLSDGTIWRLVFGADNRAADCLYQRLLETAHGGARQFPASEAALIRQAAALLSELHAGLGRRTAAEIIDRACAVTGFLGILAMQPQGEVAVAAVRRVIELSRNFESRGVRHLSDFVRWLKEKADSEWDHPGAEDKPDLEANLPETEAAVQIGTIHSAKGLEFPIVILVDIGAKPPASSAAALYTPDHGLGLRLGIEPEGLSAAADSAHHAATDAEKQAQAEEQARLLYVALTRARDYLIFSGRARSEKDATNWSNLIAAYQKNSSEQVVLLPSEHPELAAAQADPPTGGIILDGAAPALREPLTACPPAPVVAPPASARVLTRRDLRLSVSALTGWLACPRRVALNALTETQLPAPHVEESDRDAADDADDAAPEARALGTAAHAVLQAAFSEADADLEAEWQNACALEQIDSANPAAAAAFKQLQKLLASAWAKKVLAAPAAQRFTEKPFRWRVSLDPASGSTAILTGALDLLFCSGADRWQLADYKLTRLADQTEDSRLRYAWQALIYARIAAQILGVEAGQVEPALIFLNDSAPRLVPLSEFVPGAATANIAADALEKILRRVWQASVEVDPRQQPAQLWPLGATEPAARKRDRCQGCPHLATCFPI